MSSPPHECGAASPTPSSISCYLQRHLYRWPEGRAAESFKISEGPPACLQKACANPAGTSLQSLLMADEAFCTFMAASYFRHVHGHSKTWPTKGKKFLTLLKDTVHHLRALSMAARSSSGGTNRCYWWQNRVIANSINGIYIKLPISRVMDLLAIMKACLNTQQWWSHTLAFFSLFFKVTQVAAVIDIFNRKFCEHNGGLTNTGLNQW